MSDEGSVWILGAFLFVGFIFVVVGMLISAAVKKSLEPPPALFCPYVSDPMFNPKGCSDPLSTAACMASIVPGSTADVTLCKYEAGECDKPFRRRGCKCGLDGQCGFGMKCIFGSCTYSLWFQHMTILLKYIIVNLPFVVRKQTQNFEAHNILFFFYNIYTQKRDKLGNDLKLEY